MITWGVFSFFQKQVISMFWPIMLFKEHKPGQLRKEHIKSRFYSSLSSKREASSVLPEPAISLFKVSISSAVK